ncbi:MAG: sel1 repeat family protein [Nitrospira sp.]|nr:sel1 repeat family protein [Nitrospira sp.]
MIPQLLLYSLIVIGALISAGVNRSEAANSSEQLKTACEKGDAEGCFNLGVMYDEGTGVPQDVVQAVALFRKACDSELPEACINLGVAYQLGIGVKQQDAEALKYYRKGCNLKLPKGCENYEKLRMGRQ